MGYTTEFQGSFQVDKPVDDDTLNLLVGLATTRRMKRSVSSDFGVEGEFYVSGKGFAGQDREDNIVDYNSPPSTQPGLWCQWLIDEDDRRTISWNGGEKFYRYVEWIEYLINRVLAPRGYKVSGEVHWFGESRGDTGLIKVVDNKVMLPNKHKLHLVSNT